MKYEQATGQTTSTQPFTFSDLDRTPEIRRTRFILLILLGIEMFITIAIGVCRVDVAISHNTVLNAKDSSIVSQALGMFLLAVMLSVTYCVIFIVMVIRCNLRGIRTFAWLTVILLIYYFVTSFLKFIGTNSTSIKNTELEGSTMEIDILAFLKKILLPILTGSFAFKLAKLIKESTTNAIV